MLQSTLIKYCLTCEKPVKGRSDKKFCDDSCRNSYNNHLNSSGTNMVRNVNNALGRNRRVLESLLPEGEDTTRAHKEKLLELNFNFKHITHTYVTKTNKIYYYCYDMGYLPLDNDWYLVVKTREAI
jgi:hypothetical protein